MSFKNNLDNNLDLKSITKIKIQNYSSTRAESVKNVKANR